MNKKIAGISLAVLALLFIAFFVVRANMNTASQDQNLQPQTSQTETQDEVVREGDLRIATLSGSNTEVRYIAQKVFFSKPTQEVVGKNKSVTGTVVVNVVDETANVDVTIPTDGFVTDSSRRDADVAKLFNGPITVQAEEVNISDVLAGNTMTIPLTVTINDNSQQVQFEVSGEKDGDTLIASGSSTIVMSEFDVTPPSLLEVYTVEDELKIEFDVNLAL